MPEHPQNLGVQKRGGSRISAYLITASTTGFEKLSTASMAVRVVEFSNGGYKIRKIFAKESTYSKEIIEF